MGPRICKMMKAFRIWPQNSNQITFDYLFSPKSVKTEKFPDLGKISLFRQFFVWQNNNFSGNFSILNSFGAKKGVKCYLIWFLWPDSEFSRHLAYLRLPFDMIFGFWFLPPHVFFKFSNRTCLTVFVNCAFSSTYSVSELSCAKEYHCPNYFCDWLHALLSNYRYRSLS